MSYTDTHTHTHTILHASSRTLICSPSTSVLCPRHPSIFFLSFNDKFLLESVLSYTCWETSVYVFSQTHIVHVFIHAEVCKIYKHKSDLVFNRKCVHVVHSRLEPMSRRCPVLESEHGLYNTVTSHGSNRTWNRKKSDHFKSLWNLNWPRLLS